MAHKDNNLSIKMVNGSTIEFIDTQDGKLIGVEDGR